MCCLKRQLLGRVVAWQEEPRFDVAQFAGDWLRKRGPKGCDASELVQQTLMEADRQSEALASFEEGLFLNWQSWSKRQSEATQPWLQVPAMLLPRGFAHASNPFGADGHLRTARLCRTTGICWRSVEEGRGMSTVASISRLAERTLSR